MRRYRAVPRFGDALAAALAEARREGTGCLEGPARRLARLRKALERDPPGHSLTPNRAAMPQLELSSADNGW